MKGQISKGLKTAIIIYAVLWAIYGLVHVISPELVQAKDPAIERILGAAIVVLAVGAWLVYREKAWEAARIVVLLEVAWMIAYALLMAWGILGGAITADAWPPTIIGAAFAALLAILYVREQRLQAH